MTCGLFLECVRWFPLGLEYEARHWTATRREKRNRRLLCSSRLNRKAHLADLHVFRVLEAGGELLPRRSHGFAVSAPRGVELDEVGSWRTNQKNKLLGIIKRELIERESGQRVQYSGRLFRYILKSPSRYWPLWPLSELHPAGAFELGGFNFLRK